MDCSPPGSFIHGISQARMEWVAISFSRGSPQLRDRTHVPCIGKEILYHWAIWEAPISLTVLYYFFAAFVVYLLVCRKETEVSPNKRSGFCSWMLRGNLQALGMYCLMGVSFVWRLWLLDSLTIWFMMGALDHISSDFQRNKKLKS